MLADGRMYHAGNARDRSASSHQKDIVMKNSDRLSLQEISTDATVEALNAALAAAGIGVERIVVINRLPGVHATVGRAVPDRYQVLYRR